MAERELKDSCSSGKVTFGGPEVASECPENASELVRDVFECFDLLFQKKEIVMGRNNYYLWKK